MDKYHSKPYEKDNYHGDQAGVLAVRIILMFVSLGCILTGFYFISISEWSLELEKDNFIYDGCKNLKIVREDQTTNTWEDVLGNRIHKNFRFVFPSHRRPDDKIEYYESKIYLTVEIDILRSLTFDLVELHPMNIQIKTTDNCTLDYPEILRMFKEVGRDGVFAKTNSKIEDRDRGQFELYDSKSNSFKKYYIPVAHYILFILDGIVSMALIAYVMYFAGKALYAEWEEAVESLSEKYFKNAIESDKFKKYKHEACGPFFISDHIYGNPKDNMEKYGSAIISTAIHIILILIPILPLLAFNYFTNYLDVSYIVYGYLVFHCTMSGIYASIYYGNVKWRNRKFWAYLFYFFFTLSTFISMCYIIHSLLWFLLSITISPVRAASMIIGVVSLALYIQIMFKKLKEYRDTIKKSAGKIVTGLLGGSATPKQKAKKADELLKTYGLTMRDVFKMIMYGTMIIILLIAWMFISWFVMGINNKNGGIPGFISTLMVPLGTFWAKTSQISTIKDKIKKGDIQDLKNDVLSEDAIVLNLDSKFMEFDQKFNDKLKELVGDSDNTEEKKNDTNDSDSVNATNATNTSNGDTKLEVIIENQNKKDRENGLVHIELEDISNKKDS